MIANVMDGARGRFWAGLGSARRNDLARLPGWEARLATALDEAAPAGGRVWIARDDFAGELAARLNEDDEADVARWWDHCAPAISTSHPRACAASTARWTGSSAYTAKRSLASRVASSGRGYRQTI